MDYSLLLEPAILSEVLVLGLERGAMYALMASGLSLIFGIMGVKNFPHGELFMLGGYVMFYVTMVLDLPWRSEEHTSELQSLMRTSYAVFSLTKETGTTSLNPTTIILTT